jgi:hypothetical protein
VVVARLITLENLEMASMGFGKYDHTCQIKNELGKYDIVAKK